jgi:hypothetical protein
MQPSAATFSPRQKPGLCTMNRYTPAEIATLRRSAAQWRGSAVPASIGARLRHCLSTMQVLRDRNGQVAGFGREGFVLTPTGWGLYTWGEEAKRLEHINNNACRAS